jgi:uncharacterized protein (DUF362 family)
MSMRALVALIRTTPTTVLDDIGRALELAEALGQLDPARATLLRPDARRRFPFPAANTTPWQLEGAARALHAAGYRDLAWAAPPAQATSAMVGQDLSGYMPILRAYDIAPHGAADVAANLVLLPTLKTDGATHVGGALWCLLDRPRGQGVARQAHGRLVDVLAASRASHTGIAAVMDGTTAAAGAGPYRLRPEIRSVLLASADPVALDAAAARLMGFDPLADVGYLRLAHERGLGIADPRAITLVGDASLAQARWSFGPATGRRSPGGALGRALERVRWPLAERLVFESWLRGTPWGRLFARYQRMGYGEQRGAAADSR